MIEAFDYGLVVFIPAILSAVTCIVQSDSGYINGLATWFLMIFKADLIEY